MDNYTERFIIKSTKIGEQGDFILGDNYNFWNLENKDFRNPLVIYGYYNASAFCNFINKRLSNIYSNVWAEKT